MLGRHLEVSVHAPEPLGSLGFYEQLGFAQAVAGESWPWPYAVVTDGRLAIGLHGQELPSPTLSFVLPGLLQHIGELERIGVEPDSRALGGDVFNHVEFADPDGHALRLVEARTFSPVARGPGQTSDLGWFEEVALPVADLAAAVRWWEALGFVPAEEGTEPWPHVAMTSDSLNVSLVRAPALSRPALVFTDPDMAARIAALASRGIAVAGRLPAGLKRGDNAMLIAPEGTQLLLLTGD